MNRHRIHAKEHRMSELEQIRERRAAAERHATPTLQVPTGELAFLLDTLDSAMNLMGDLTDQEDCTFDHHGGCQAHGYLSLVPGEKCPQQEAKDMIAEIQGGKA